MIVKCKVICECVILYSHHHWHCAFSVEQISVIVILLKGGIDRDTHIEF